jgi:hypothetical protein
LVSHRLWRFDLQGPFGSNGREGREFNGGEGKGGERRGGILIKYVFGSNEGRGGR